METTSKSLREVIKETVRFHLTKNNGIAMGQCLTAVGWVGGTLPELYEEDGMVELSMADVAGGGFAVGAALAGKRPMYIIRYQGFNWFNAAIPINYAAKSKELWQKPCPMFIRSIAMEGSIGPVAGSSHHALYFRMPGIEIYSPMTPNEYVYTYKKFMESDNVFYVSEHRGAYDNTKELENISYDKPDITLFPISITRFAAMDAAKELKTEGVNIAIHHIFELKPFKPSEIALQNLKNSTYGGIVLDDDYTDGVAKSIAFNLNTFTDAKMQVMGLEDRSAGFAKILDNLPPNKEQIYAKIKSTIQKR
jgi:pyruvate dehydrogenase E1 component beta subunit